MAYRDEYIVDTDGNGWFYVVPRDDKAFVVQGGAHTSYRAAKDHANTLNERNNELTRTRSLSDDYSFRERIYDATQDARDNPNITVVIANYSTRSIHVAKDFPTREAAYEYIFRLGTSDESFYVIGGDILDG